MDFCRLVGNCIHYQPEEITEHDIHHRSHTGHCGTHSHACKARLRDWRIKSPSQREVALAVGSEHAIEPIGPGRIAEAFPDLDLDRVAALIDRTLRPQSRRLDPARLSYVEYRSQFTARLENIIGLLPGADPVLAAEAVVVAAHYDHIGTGGALSESPLAAGQVHNGADDNASGVAALIEMARAAPRTRARFRRTLVFASLAGEELGLRGSEHYAVTPPIPLARTRAMINLDMVGRARGRVMVGVFGPQAQGSPVPARLRPWTRLTVQDFGRGGYGLEESDVGPFARRGVPAIAFFTGFHSDYHRPSDDWAAIDVQQVVAIQAGHSQSPHMHPLSVEQLTIFEASPPDLVSIAATLGCRAISQDGGRSTTCPDGWYKIIG